ncbi:carotenoid biosynthesis protein [Candidatus Solirubrobacter pratensis]|uniref:carotenoid biosynthesis protein n=1 Tax=Candidatus Solirubrobacter pratensis TaxID=1298857 RepID=UPI0012DF9322|nr:carotenoid biosynthesis protein [Candidatus Solirubrobacter pratensis]
MKTRAHEHGAAGAGARARRAVRVVRRARPITPARVLLGALALEQIAYGRAAAPRPPAETRGVVLLMLAASAAEALEARGPRGALALAAAGATGFGAELAGVATGVPFGRYAYSDRLGPRVRGVPLLAAAGWAVLARPAWVVAGRISDRRALRVPLAAGALTAWDVFLDPRMAREGYWTWPDGGAYEGVPATNFAGWLATGLAAFAFVAAADGARPQERDDGALALYVWTWAGETIANAALWRRPAVAAAGAPAMGAFAIAALLKRFR